MYNARRQRIAEPQCIQLHVASPRTRCSFGPFFFTLYRQPSCSSGSYIHIGHGDGTGSQKTACLPAFRQLGPPTSQLNSQLGHSSSLCF